MCLQSIQLVVSFMGSFRDALTEVTFSGIPFSLLAWLCMAVF